MYADHADALPPRLDALERDLSARGLGYRYFRALDLAAQANIWSLREAALGLSMAMKDEAKSISFVEDTAVAPERLRDYIDRFLGIVRKHGTTAGVYAHASVGCLHVRPVVNMKTAQGVRTFEAIANEVSDLVLEFGGALSGEHGDGLVRSPFMAKMFGPVLYEAFRDIKRTFDPLGILNPGKIVDAPPLASNLRYGPGYVTPQPATWFDYAEFGGLGGAVDMCSGLGVCRKTLEARCVRHTWPSAKRRTRRAGAPTSCVWPWPAGSANRGWATKACARCSTSVSNAALQDGMPGRRRHGALQERVPRGLLEATWNAASGPGNRPRSRDFPMGLSNGSPVELAGQSAVARWANEWLLGFDRRRRPPHGRRGHLRRASLRARAPTIAADRPPAASCCSTTRSRTTTTLPSVTRVLTSSKPRA